MLVVEEVELVVECNSRVVVVVVVWSEARGGMSVASGREGGMRGGRRGW